MLNEASICASEASKQVVIKFDGNNKLELSSQDIDFGTSYNSQTIVEVVDGGYVPNSGVPVTQAFKIDFLLTALAHDKNELNVSLMLNSDPLRCAIIDRKILLMPMMIS